jgi:ketosteroid isomerase-like protein
MTAMYSESILADPFDEAKAEVESTLKQIMSAARRRAVDELESYHAFGPKFTKFDDFEPLGRQDAETTRRLERETLIGVKEFTPDVVDLKVDVFGPVAVATFVMAYDVVTEDEQMSLRARSTMVFAHDKARWLIVHEHFSPFPSNA